MVIKKYPYWICLTAIFLYFNYVNAATIILHERNAVAWLPQQTLRGELAGFTAKTVTIHQDSKTFTVSVKADNTFSCSLTLHNAKNTIWAQASDEGRRVFSDTITLALGYHPEPLVKPFAIVTGNTAFLHVTVIYNPWSRLLFRWTGDKRNPAAVKIKHPADSLAQVQIPAADGIYYFNLSVASGKDTARFQTFVTRHGNTVQAFNLDTAHAAWINDAVVYEITPYIFVKDATYDDITAKLPELKSLGINTIWLQPVFKTFDGGQGYDVIDYFSLREDLGTEAQLAHLVQTAKALQLRVLFDFVPNHTSVHHPYAMDCAANGTDSHYYTFYQHTDDGVLYSSNYHQDKQGFIYYFWNDLVNLNYTNKEVQQWMVEACKYWIKKLDIDGYRFDAVWGVNARQPTFGKQLQLALKVIKPDLLLLAEDKGAFTDTYAKGFDAAFDWTGDTSWVSQWSWQYDYNPQRNPTIFNFPNAGERGPMLGEALFANGDIIHARLHFTENNDLPRFITSHGLARTKMAAALTFALPGIPLVNNGQETGTRKNISRSNPIFKSGQSIQSLDEDSLFTYYQQLTAMRASHPCLRNALIDEVQITPAGPMIAFLRWNEQEQVITAVNMDAAATMATLDMHTILSKTSNGFTLTDLLSKEVFTYKNANPTKVEVPMNGYSTRLLLLSSSQTSWIVLEGPQAAQ